MTNTNAPSIRIAHTGLVFKREVCALPGSTNLGEVVERMLGKITKLDLHRTTTARPVWEARKGFRGETRCFDTRREAVVWLAR